MLSFLRIATGMTSHYQSKLTSTIAPILANHKGFAPLRIKRQPTQDGLNKRKIVM